MARGHDASSRPAVNRRTGRRVALWRVALATPATVGSLLMLFVLFGPLAGWRLAGVLMCWPAAGAILWTPAGERLAMRLCCDFRPPSTSQTAVLRTPLAAALRRTGTAAEDVDLYVQPQRQPNAYAVGRRSVAVTTGAVEYLLARQLTDEQLVAVLVHELGHRATGSTRAGLVTAWLTALWRLATRLVLRLAEAMAGRRPRSGLAWGVPAVGVVLAMAQAATERNWAVAAVLSGVSALAVLCSLSGAALARADEWSADRYAADHGLALPLATALGVLDDDHRTGRGWARLLASHPPVDRRIDALLVASDEPTVSARAPRPGTSRGAAVQQRAQQPDPHLHDPVRTTAHINRPLSSADDPA